MAAITSLGAIITVFDASPAGTTGDTQPSGGCWVGEIPEQFTDQSLPIVCLMHKGDTPGYTFEGMVVETTHFDFLVYGVGLAATEATAKKIKTTFDKPGTTDAVATFSITNAHVIRCWRPEGQTGYKIDAIGQRVSTGEKVFRATLSYEFEVGYPL